MGDAGKPFFSIVIPTFARPQQLTACLDSLARLHYGRTSFEVLVVDDGGPAPLDEIVEAFANTLDIRLLRQDNAGPAAARNAGARHAKGDYLVFIDDDCSPASDYLAVLAAQTSRAPGCAIGGTTVNALTRNLYSTTSQMLNDYLYSHFNADRSRARFLTSNNMVVPTRIFRQLDGFDTRFRRAAFEDRELCERLLHHGYTILYAPEAVVYHSHGMTLRQFCRQHFTYGRGAAIFHRNESERPSGDRPLEPTSFYFNLVRYPFSQRSKPSAILIASVILLSQAATAVGFFRERLSIWWRRTSAAK